MKREIKSIEISSHAETDFLASIIFEDLLKNKSKHKYVPFKRDYAFNRICDDKPWGKKLEYDITFEVISPMHDQYSVLNAGKCLMHSLNTDGTILVKLDNDQDLTGKYPGKREINECLGTVTNILDIHDSFELIKEFIKRKDDLLDAQEDFQDLQDFYINQKQTWETLLDALERFKPNRSDFEKDAGAQKAFTEMCSIAESQRPYDMLKGVNALIATVETVNSKKIEAHQNDVVNEIEYKIKHIVELLNENSADDDFRNEMLFPLQNCKKIIAGEYSIPVIAYSVREIQERYDDALISIEEKFRDDDDPIKIKKEIATIKISKLNNKAHLESEDDVNSFIERVKTELLNAINDNYRVKIQ